MNASENDKKNQNRQRFSIDTVLEFVKKNIRYISAGVLFLALVLVLWRCTGTTGGNASGEDMAATENVGTLTNEYQVDAVPEVNDLIQNYYTAYASGKTKQVRKYAAPLTKNERSFIKLFSENVEEYRNLKCYTKKGMTDGSYLVSVYLEIKFKDVDTLAPGLDFFYVETNDAGKLIINNRYSQFNLLNKEKKLDENIQALIESFEQEADVVKLRQEVQKKYEDALASDEKLAEMMNTTIAQAYTTWAQNIASSQGTAGEDSQEDETAQNPAEIVYALDTVNIRSEANENATVVDMAVAGTALTRIGTTKDGWSKLTYDGKEVYVKSDYLTTEKPKKEEENTGDTTTDNQGQDTPSDNTTSDSQNTSDSSQNTSDSSQSTDTSGGGASGYAEGKKITLSQTVNVRASMGETAEKVGTAFEGETVTVIFSYAEGWTKVEWNGQTGFVKTEFLK